MDITPAVGPSVYRTGDGRRNAGRCGREASCALVRRAIVTVHVSGLMGSVVEADQSSITITWAVDLVVVCLLYSRF
jgi:hypothetical protein